MILTKKIKLLPISNQRLRFYFEPILAKAEDTIKICDKAINEDKMLPTSLAQYTELKRILNSKIIEIEVSISSFKFK